MTAPAYKQWIGELASADGLDEVELEADVLDVDGPLGAEELSIEFRAEMEFDDERFGEEVEYAGLDDDRYGGLDLFDQVDADDGAADEQLEAGRDAA